MKTTKIREALEWLRCGEEAMGNEIMQADYAAAQSELDALAVEKADTIKVLRDTFAAAALTALVGRKQGFAPSQWAEEAYTMADAMLAAREAK